MFPFYNKVCILTDWNCVSCGYLMDGTNWINFSIFSQDCDCCYAGEGLQSNWNECHNWIIFENYDISNPVSRNIRCRHIFILLLVILLIKTLYKYRFPTYYSLMGAFFHSTEQSTSLSLFDFKLLHQFYI